MRIVTNVSPNAAFATSVRGVFELRNALIYNYHQTADSPEERQWTWNLQLGRTARRNERSALKDYFFQIHRGVNPYGQLRSQKDYWSAGVGWVFGF